MAKLSRKTQKIFASNSAQNQVSTFGSIKAGAVAYSKDVSNIQTEAFEGGWSSAVQDDYAPYRQDRNAVDFVTTSQLAYVFQEGLPEYDANTTYYKGSWVKGLDGDTYVIYESLSDDNIGNNLSDEEKWEAKSFGVKLDYANRALISNANGEVAVSAVTSTELGYLDGVTSNIQTQLNGKQASGSYANTSASNFNATGKSTIIGWVMPDYSAGISVTTPTSSSPFIAPKDGIYVLNGVNNNTITNLYINGIKSAYMLSSGSQYRDSQSMTIFMSKNDSCYLDGTITARSQVFYPLKGAN